MCKKEKPKYSRKTRHMFSSSIRGIVESVYILSAVLLRLYFVARVYCLVHGILSSRCIVKSMFGRFGVLLHIVTSVNCRVSEQWCRSAVARTCSSVSVNVPVI